MCSTEVVLQVEEEFEEGSQLFPDHLPHSSSHNMGRTFNIAPSRALLSLVTFIIIVPILVTFIIDYTHTHSITWSFYPMTSLTLLWVLFAYPAILKRHTVFQIITSDFFAVIVFLISLDLYSGPFPEWSLYPAVSLLLVWVYISAPLVLKWKYPVLVIGMWFLGTATFLYAIDIMTKGEDWFFLLGLPIVAVIGIVAALLAIILKCFSNKPFFIAGMSAFFAAFSLVIIDGVVNLYLSRLFCLTWSPILVSVLFPTAVFLVVINYNQDLKAYLSKKFHL